MTQLILHLLGDYLTQSDWMARKKRTSSIAAMAHAIVYSIPFLWIASESAFEVILLTHFFIDRFGLARYVVYVKNLLAPKSYWFPWSRCAATGYPDDLPPWLAVWLLIIADNTFHLAINAAAIRYL